MRGDHFIILGRHKATLKKVEFGALILCVPVKLQSATK